MNPWKINRIGDLVIELSSDKLGSASDYFELEKFLLTRLNEGLISEIVISSTALDVVFLEPFKDIEGLENELERFKSNARPQTTASKLIDIPVCYDPEFGTDLDHVSQMTNLPVEEVIAMHQEASYSVEMFGFLPGFAYLEGLPAALQLPRKDSPATKVIRGSVAIANTRSAVYPFDSPGGWYVIGRTPVSMVDFSVSPPFTLQVGWNVRFLPISKNEFDHYDD